MAALTCRVCRNKGAAGPFWRKCACLGQVPSCLWGGPPPARLAWVCAPALECLWSGGTKSCSLEVSVRRASCSRVASPGSWIFWKSSQFHCLLWIAVVSAPSLRRCTQWTTSQHPANSASETTVSRGTCTKESLPRACRSWLACQRHEPDRNQPA